MRFSPHKKIFVIRLMVLSIIVSNALIVNATSIIGHTQNYNQVQAQAKVELNVIITKPAKGHFYINDEDQGNTTIGATRIIGSITIKASVSGGDGGIDRVEFLISDVSRFIDYDPPYEWLWDDTAIGTITIKVKAFDTAGNESSSSLNVRVIMNLKVTGIETRLQRLLRP